MSYTLTTEEILGKYLSMRKHSEEICEPLEVEDYVPQPMENVSPPKWHLGHTTWFFEQIVLVPHLKGFTVFHPDFAFLFNSYYNNLGDRSLRSHRGFMTRPTVKNVYEYRAFVDEKMSTLLQGKVSQEVLKLIEIGINHEQQHQELLVYDIKYILANQPTFPEYGSQFVLSPDTSQAGWIQKEGGLYKIGSDDSEFSYDNEHPQHQVFLKPFEISSKLVSNREYLEFMEAGGYEDHNLWLDEGWSFINQNEVRAPLYWFFRDGNWLNYTMEGLTEINLDAPIQHVSLYEAFAFAEWKGLRLPTEFEWEVAADDFSWGKLWEWTYSAYQPYPGYSKVPGPLGEYNGKFMMNQNVLRGASIATPKGHERKTYRNFFPASARWIRSGIRLAKPLES